MSQLYVPGPIPIYVGFNFVTPQFLGWAERGVSAIAAGLLIFPTLTTDAAGFAVAAGLFGWRQLAARKARRGDRPIAS